ncbi:ribonuclease P protein component [Candidatus Parcubacteria bacterium]|nr:ribonuclease P protein component [Candidatus Parcubacteria bacterium]
MLAIKYRLTKQKDFDNVWQTGRSNFNEALGIKISKNKLAVSRFGFIVSAKISKKAVDRNQIKRRLRQVIKDSLKDIKPGYDVVIITQKAVVNKEYKEIKDLVLKGLSKLKLLK